MSAGENNNYGQTASHMASQMDGESLVPFDVREQTGRRSILVLAAFIVGLLLIALAVVVIS